VPPEFPSVAPSAGSAERKARLVLTAAIIVGGVSCIGGVVLLILGLSVGTATFGIHLLGSGDPCIGTEAAEAITKVGFFLLVSGPLLGWVAVPALVRWAPRRKRLAWTIAGPCFAAVTLMVILLATSRSCR